MPPSYKSRTFEIFYFCKLKVTHDSAFSDPVLSEPVVLRFEQTVDKELFVNQVEDGFDAIEFTEQVRFVPKKSLTMEQFIQRDQAPQMMPAMHSQFEKPGKGTDADLMFGKVGKLDSN
jgi:hypothetical protein